ncbi:MAG: hypothetical protein HY270_15245 [Deltaproteobacteria bacterium]|nr:hypothetical protein [Deltaproteobacteria bacterium]
MPLSDESLQRPPPQPTKSNVDLRLSLVHGGASFLWRYDPSGPPKSLTRSEIVALTASLAGRPGSLLIGGAEPLERDDLPQLLDDLARQRPTNLGVYTVGRGLSKDTALRLRSAGVKRVHVPFHCARQDAHDWLVGQNGALKAAHRAIRACVEAEIPVTAEISLARPTVAHLAETILVLARLGVRTMHVRRLTADDVDGPTFVSLSPRLSLLGDSLEEAATVALERRVRLSLRDLPVCVAPRLRPLFAAADSELWVMADGSLRSRNASGQGCAACPERPQCAGVPSDYAARFGWEEFSEHEPGPRAQSIERPAETAAGENSVERMVFDWRGPHRVRCEACGDAAADAVKLQQPYEPTRRVRARLVQAARYRPSRLRLVGTDLFAHPQAALLIYDAVRLFAHVEVAGEASALVDWSDLDLRRLKDLRRIDVALYGPDAATHDAHCGIPGAFSAMLRGVANICAKTAIPVGAYAVLHDARLVSAFAEAWASGRLPGEPRFRLSAQGASLDELIDCARALPQGPSKAALVAVLPSCLCAEAGLEVGGPNTALGSQEHLVCGKRTAYEPKSSDPVGAFEICNEGAGTCAWSSCPGIAVGWQSVARAKRWNLSH